MSIPETVSYQELLLLLVALFGAAHHALMAVRIRRSCTDASCADDRLLCRIYVRQEVVRLMLACLIAYGAAWMMTRPPVLGDSGPASLAAAAWRYGLVVAIAGLNVESVMAWRDRARIGRVNQERQDEP